MTPSIFHFLIPETHEEGYEWTCFFDMLLTEAVRLPFHLAAIIFTNPLYNMYIRVRKRRNTH